MKFLIRQYEIDPALHQPTVIYVPQSATLLKVHSSNGEHVFAWFLIDADAVANVKYDFYTVPSEWEVPPTHPIISKKKNVKYFNTVFIRDGEIVFHVFCSDPYLDTSTDK